ncbi:MAG TPA: 3D domain-containing protein [Chloroflexota bacterium]|nr:3D domain-containing protein [Chloroflexota bacterium]
MSPTIAGTPRALLAAAAHRGSAAAFRRLPLFPVSAPSVSASIAGSAAVGLMPLEDPTRSIALNAPLLALVAFVVISLGWATRLSAVSPPTAPAIGVTSGVASAGALLQRLVRAVPSAPSVLLARLRPGEPWVLVQVDGKAVHVQGAERIEAALAAAGLRLEPGDRVVTLPNGGQRLVERAVPFSIIDSGVPYGQRVVARSVGEALAAAGITIDAADTVVPPPDTLLEPGMQIALFRARFVTITAPDVRLDARTRAATVAELLAEHGLALGPRDRVEPPVESTPPANGIVRVVRVEELEQRELSLIQFQTRIEYSADVPAGVRQRRRAGAAGLLERLVHVIFENDEEVERIPLSERILRAATDEIIALGRPGLSPLPLAPALPATPVTPAISTIPGAPEVPFRRVVNMVATAYDPGPISTGKAPGHPAYGITATGIRATYGVVAVDPSVIPFYTRLYIPGYGYAIAADTGGAIRGNRIDLFYPTYGEAIQWGRRSVPVYILE